MKYCVYMLYIPSGDVHRPSYRTPYHGPRRFRHKESESSPPVADPRHRHNDTP